MRTLTLTLVVLAGCSSSGGAPAAVDSPDGDMAGGGETGAAGSAPGMPAPKVVDSAPRPVTMPIDASASDVAPAASTPDAVPAMAPDAAPPTIDTMPAPDAIELRPDSATPKDATGEGQNPRPPMTFFVTSEGSPSGNLGGLEGADAKCQKLAAAAGSGRTWRAYLGIAPLGLPPVHPRDRIGKGPWFNANGQSIGDLASLHAPTTGVAPAMILDERGRAVPDGETGILTGAAHDGTVYGARNCHDWTRGGSDIVRLGHASGPSAAWNDAQGAECGGTSWVTSKTAGRFYCFAVD